MGANFGFIAIVAAVLLVVFGGSIAASTIIARQKGAGAWTASKQPMIIIIGTVFATAMGSSLVTFMTGLGYAHGWSVLTYSLCQGGGIFLLVVMGKWLSENNFTSIPVVFRRIFGESKALYTFVALVSTITPFSWIAGQCTGFGKMLSGITGLPVTTLAIAFAVLCLIFVLPAGFSTVAISDTVLGIFMFVCMIAMTFFGISSAGGWSAVAATQTPETSAFPISMVSVGVSQVLLWVCAQFPVQMVNSIQIQRVGSVSDPKSVKKTMTFSALAVIICAFFAYFVGQAIHSLNPNIEDAETALSWFITTLPVWATGVFVALVGALIMSTADSAVQTTVSILIGDIYRNIINPKANDKTVTRLSRIACVAVLGISLLLGLRFTAILSLIQTANSYVVGTLLVPMYIGYLLFKRGRPLSKTAAWAGLLTGFGVCLVCDMFLDLPIPFVIPALILNLVVFLSVNAATATKVQEA